MAIDIDLLNELHEEESRAATNLTPKAVLGGVVSNIRALYEDKILLRSGNIAFHRPGAPLYALPFFASKIVAFIPPLPLAELEKLQGGTPFSLLERLIAAKRVIPIIGFPKDYSSPNCTYLKKIVERKPVSMPARGHALVHAMGLGNLFEVARADKRLLELSTLPTLQSRWAAEFPHVATDPSALRDRVLFELVNNYIDLFIFGYQALLEEILFSKDPFTRANSLLKASELLTYPSLIGLDGRAQYTITRSEDIRQYVSEQNPRFVSLPVMKAICDGIDVPLDALISQPDKYMQVIEQLHVTGTSHEIEKIHDSYIAAAAEAGDLTDEALNSEANRLVNRIDLAKQELVDVAPAIATRYRLSKTFMGVGAATLGPIATLLGTVLKNVGFEHALLLGASVAATGAVSAYILANAEGFQHLLEKHVAKEKLREAWAFELWSIRKGLNAK